MTMIKGDRRNASFMTNLVAVISATAALAFVFVGISGSALGQASKHSSGSQKSEIIERVRKYPDTSIGFENYEGVPLSIQEANVKEIGNVEYNQLTGLTTDLPKYVSFPNVTLTNNTDQRIIGLTLAVGNRQTKRIHGVKLSNIIIEPHGTISVKTSDFVRPERTVHITKAGKVTDRLEPDLDSEKMWFQGSASDVVIVVGMVDYENGTRWIIDSSKDPW
ncbi:MAG TPA: hypothetical protein VJ843_00575 [Candidatus Saccharimonadales bacterium]|nr:hypothetical protein [Candidatus Saccharimonadales bacterium]